MTRQELVLNQLAEECAEVAQRVSKALRFGLDEVQPGQSLTNAERILSELVDLRAVWLMLTKSGSGETGYGFECFRCLTKQEEFAMLEAKMAKVEKFLGFSAARGRVDGVAADMSVPHPEALATS